MPRQSFFNCKPLTLLLPSLTLIACGGGGGGSNESRDPIPSDPQVKAKLSLSTDLSHAFKSDSDAMLELEVTIEPLNQLELNTSLGSEQLIIQDKKFIQDSGSDSIKFEAIQSDNTCKIGVPVSEGHTCQDQWRVSTTQEEDNYQGQILYTTNVGQVVKSINITFKSPHDPQFNMDKFSISNITPIGTGIVTKLTINNATERTINNPQVIFPDVIKPFIEELNNIVEIASGDSKDIMIKIKDSAEALSALKQWQADMIINKDALIKYKSARFPQTTHEIHPEISLTEFTTSTTILNKFNEKEDHYEAVFSILNTSGQDIENIDSIITPQNSNIRLDNSLCELPLMHGNSCLLKVQVLPDIATSATDIQNFQLSLNASNLTHRDPTNIDIQLNDKVTILMDAQSTMLANYDNQILLKNTDLMHWIPSDHIENYTITNDQGDDISNRFEIRNSIKQPSCLNGEVITKNNGCYLTIKPLQNETGKHNLLKINNSNVKNNTLALPSYNTNGIQSDIHLNPEAVVKNKDVTLYFTIAPPIEKTYLNFELSNVNHVVQDTYIENSCVEGMKVSASSPCLLKLNIPADQVMTPYFSPQLTITWQDQTKANSDILIEVKDPDNEAEDLSKLNELHNLDGLVNYIDVNDDHIVIHLQNNTSNILAGVKLNINAPWLTDLFDLSPANNLISIAKNESTIITLPLLPSKTVNDLYQSIINHHDDLFANAKLDNSGGKIVSISSSNSISEFRPEIKVDVIPYINLEDESATQNYTYEMLFTEPARKYVKITNPTTNAFSINFSEALPQGINRVFTGSIDSLANCSEFPLLQSGESCALVVEVSVDAAEKQGDHIDVLLKAQGVELPDTKLTITFKTSYVYQVGYAADNPLLEIPDSDSNHYDIKLVNNESDLSWVPSMNLNDYILSHPDGIEGIQLLSADHKDQLNCLSGTAVGTDGFCYLGIKVDTTAISKQDYKLTLNKGTTGSNLAGDNIHITDLPVVPTGKANANLLQQGVIVNKYRLGTNIRVNVVPPKNWTLRTAGEDQIYNIDIKNDHSEILHSSLCRLSSNSPNQPCTTDLLNIDHSKLSDHLIIEITDQNGGIPLVELENNKLSIPVIKDTWKQISAGKNHTCAVTEAGNVYCWGKNSSGQIGDSSTINRTQPSLVGEGLGYKYQYVAAGDTHSCAVLDKETIGPGMTNMHCWGSHTRGQLGNGNLPGGISKTPYPVYGLTQDNFELSSLTLGDQFSCVAYTGQNGQHHNTTCWGRNDKAQLGNNTFTDAYYPKTITVNDRIENISAGTNHACAKQLFGDGAYCWGENKFGETGQGNKSDYTQLSSATLVKKNSGSTLIEIAKVDSGSGHSCATTYSGELYCWGANHFGQLGTGTYGSGTEKTYATKINTSSLNIDKYSIQTGSEYSCMITDDTKVACWGSAGFGQMGVSDTSNKRLNPTVVMDFSDKVTQLTQLSLGSHHTCVLGVSKQNPEFNRIFCTGHNSYGQVSGSTAHTVSTPREVLLP